MKNAKNYMFGIAEFYLIYLKKTSNLSNDEYKLAFWAPKI